MGNVPIQMGLKTDQTSYQHGDTITGTVYLSVTSVDNQIQSYTGIRLSLVGVENTTVKIRENNGDRGTTFRSERESVTLLSVETSLVDFESPLRVARYEFPFEWRLPDAPLPSSFRHRSPSQDGLVEVKYTLSAYLDPPPSQSSGLFGSNNSGGTFASQGIQILGKPSRPMPEPINLAEERTNMHGMCCCWHQGHVSLGWEADSIVLVPQSSCHLTIHGSNESQVPIPKLRIQLLQEIHWQAGGDFQKEHKRQTKTVLVDYYVDLTHLRQWDALDKSGQKKAGYQSVVQDDGTLQANNNDHDQHRPILTSFDVPPDCMDSYVGRNCRVEHTLVVSAVTRFFATTPSVPYTIHIQRPPTGSGGADLPVATAWRMEEADYQDAVLPSDWTPDEKVPVIHVQEIAIVDDHGMNSNSAGGTMATAEAVMVHPNNYNMPNAAVSTLMAASSTAVAGRSIPNDDSAANNKNEDDPMAFARPAGVDLGDNDTAALEEPEITPELRQVYAILQDVDPSDMESHRKVEFQIRNAPTCQQVLEHLTPAQYQYLCQAATPNTLNRVAYLLATELNYQDGGFRGEYLMALMQLKLAKDRSISILGNLTDQVCDLEESSAYIESALSPEDANWFRQLVEDTKEKKKQAAAGVMS